MDRAAWSAWQWDGLHVRVLDPQQPGNYCASICANNAVGIALKMRTGQSEPRSALCSYWHELTRAQGLISASVCESPV